MRITTAMAVGVGYASYDAGPYGAYGSAGYDGPYGYGGYGYGWYGDFYYPSAGIYVYDRELGPYRWTEGQRRYWQSRPGFGNPQGRPHWQAFGGGVGEGRQGYGRAPMQQGRMPGAGGPHYHASAGGGGGRGGGHGRGPR